MIQILHSYQYSNKAFFIVLFFLFNSFLATSQNVYVPEIDFTAKAYYYNDLEPKDALPFTQKDTAEIILKIPNHQVPLALYIGTAEISELEIDDKKYFSGKYMDPSLLHRTTDQVHVVLPFPMQSNIVKLKSYNLSDRPFYIAPKLLPVQQLNKGGIKLINDVKIGVLITFLYLGGIFIFFIYTLGLYIQNRSNKDFLYYSIYLLTNLIHAIIQSDSMIKAFKIFPHNPIAYHQFNEFTQMLSYPIFIIFICQFLNLKETSPRAYKLSKMAVYFCILGAFAFLINGLFFKAFHFTEHYLSAIWIVTSIFAFGILFWIYRDLKSKLKYYVIFGSTLLIIGAIAELVISIVTPGAYYWNIYNLPEGGLFPFNYSQIAILLEITFFALGIGYKIRLLDQELLEYKELEISRLEEESQTKALKIKNLSEDLAFQKAQLEKQNYLFKDMKTKFGVVKNQLNPQFIFNNLNTINHKINTSSKEEASDYVIQFTNLIRKINSKSSKTLIPLGEEIDMLVMFLEIENQRLNKSFQSELTIEDKQQIKHHLVPPFLLQEYIEYVLWTHVLPAVPQKYIRIHFEIIGEVLTIQITDNGEANPPTQDKQLQYILDRIKFRILSYLDKKDSYDEPVFYESLKNNLGNKLSILIPVAANNPSTI